MTKAERLLKAYRDLGNMATGAMIMEDLERVLMQPVFTTRNFDPIQAALRDGERTLAKKLLALMKGELALPDQQENKEE